MNKDMLLEYTAEEPPKPLSDEQIAEADENFRNEQENDAVVGETYSDYMHGEKVNQE